MITPSILRVWNHLIKEQISRRLAYEKLVRFLCLNAITYQYYIEKSSKISAKA
jgi:hypothetical protein